MLVQTLKRRNNFLILNKTAFAFGAFYRSSENPERKGKQNDEKGEQCEKRRLDFGETFALNKNGADAVESVRRRIGVGENFSARLAD